MPIDLRQHGHLQGEYPPEDALRESVTDRDIVPGACIDRVGTGRRDGAIIGTGDIGPGIAVIGIDGPLSGGQLSLLSLTRLRPSSFTAIPIIITTRGTKRSCMKARRGIS